MSKSKFGKGAKNGAAIVDSCPPFRSINTALNFFFNCKCLEEASMRPSGVISTPTYSAV